jgi:transcriptional regulator with PAS, ATPase and Fis domain
MENKKKSSAKDRLNAKQAKKIGKQQREYIPYDWALIFKANGRNMTKTAKALDISRYTLIRYLKADEELRNSFNDVKLVALSFCCLLGLG